MELRVCTCMLALVGDIINSRYIEMYLLEDMKSYMHDSEPDLLTNSNE